MRQAGSSVIVYILDDDDAVRNSLARLVRSVGMEVRAYASAKCFLDEIKPTERSCILLDLTMSELTGLQVQAELNRRGVEIPVIAVSARDDEDTRSRTRALGALMFLRKPVDDQALLDAINWVTHSSRTN